MNDGNVDSLVPKLVASSFLVLQEKEDNSSSDNNLIGQFGVGFYSAFLVANKVSLVRLLFSSKLTSPVTNCSSSY